ncbi:Ninja-family protein 1 [Dichanthelium oligosanthes]|uniref:Ninja-family protein n=1 Tax=Dichanthelium oligosanthes TaxID=888268 RepID=A0A1E5VSN2_9POAL|nr:Ninja-family protein 1 [Dichanthelium oligosanthes]
MPQKRNPPAQKGAESFAAPISSRLPREGRSRPRRGEAAARHLINGGLVPPPRRASRMRALPVTSLRATRSEMEGYSRDLLGGIGRGDAQPQEQEQRPGPAQVEMEEVELSLSLSLGGRFGVDRKGEKLARSSSVAAVMMSPVEVAASPALGRTSSLPAQAEASEVGREQGLDGWGSCRETGGLAVEPAARLPASGSPSSGSSDGEGLRLQDTLIRSASLPASVDAAGTEEWGKRKAAQSLKRLELKKKRIERRNSLTCGTSKEAAGQILEEVKAHTDKSESCDDKYLMKGLPPKHQATSTSQDHLSGVQRKQNSAFKGTATAEEHSSSSAVTPPGEAASSATVASPPFSTSSSSSAGRGDPQSTSGTAAARARSMGDVERTIMRDMPSVFTQGLPNGNRVEGVLYRYGNGEAVRIVCICHGSFHTPAEFVEHAGGGNVANPLRHIVVSALENA